MKEPYIFPELNVICFAPVERLANSEDPLNVNYLLDLGAGGEGSNTEIEDEDFGIDIT